MKVEAGGEKHVVYKSAKNSSKATKGDIMVNHPTKDKGKWDTINLTKIGRAKTVKQGVAFTKKWHKDNPDYKYKGKKRSSIKCTKCKVHLDISEFYTSGKKATALQNMHPGVNLVF